MVCSVNGHSPEKCGTGSVWRNDFEPEIISVEPTQGTEDFEGSWGSFTNYNDKPILKIFCPCPYCPFLPNSSFAFPSSVHATFSKNFVLCHLWTMRSVTTNGRCSSWSRFYADNVRAGENKTWNLSHKLEGIGDFGIKAFPIFFSFLLISHDRVAFGLVKNRSQAEAEN